MKIDEREINYSFPPPHSPGWRGLSALAKKRYILRGLGELEHTDLARQQAALSKMLYVNLGVFGEVDGEANVVQAMNSNTMLFFRCGGLTTVLELFGQECARLNAVDVATTEVTMVASRTIRGLAGALKDAERHPSPVKKYSYRRNCNDATPPLCFPLLHGASRDAECLTVCRI